MTRISRRVLLGTLAASPFAAPAIIRAHSVSTPVTIGFLSDVGGVSAALYGCPLVKA
jgi:branched-chain amino acid transport system substrate-binding protein